MKKSKIAKLALMGASVTALAATLTTSTYAWYVSNKTASVTAVSGSTAAAAADGSILVSVDGKYGTFYRSISLGNFVPGNNGYGLQPVQSSNGTAFYALDGTTAATIGSVGGANGSSNWTTSCDVYHYTFYIISPFADVATVTPEITITNTTSVFPTQVNMSNNSTWNTASGLEVNQLFTANALNALVLTGTRTPHATQGGYGGNGYNGTAQEAGFQAGTTTTANIQPLSTDLSTTAYPIGTFLKTVNGNAWTTTSTGTTAILDEGAHAYYDLFADTALTTDQKTQATTNAFTTFSLKAATPVRLDYYLYLDGADDACFNACASQGISIEFKFKA